MKTNAFPLLLSAAFLVCAGGLAGGCQQQKQAQSVAGVVQAAQTKAPPTFGYVRINDLIKASPLQADLQRLNEAQRRLLRFDTVGQDGASVVLSGYVLPPLSFGETNSASVRAANLRQQNARTRLDLNATRSLIEFENETRQNTDRRAAQKQSERIAEAEIAGAGALRTVKQNGDRETRNKVGELTGPLTVSRSKNAINEAQLFPAVPGADTGLTPVLDEAAFEAEIAKLKADGKAKGVSERARLELRRRVSQARIDALEREIRQIVAQGDAQVRADIARLRAERLAKIKQEIARLQAESGVEDLLQNEKKSLAAILQAENAASERARRIALAGAQGVAGSVALGDLGGSAGVGAGASGDVVRAKIAAQKIQKQREVLRALIIADARESIRDNAQTRNIDVVVIEPGAVKQTQSVDKRRDMTNDFKRWFLEIGAERPQTISGSRSRDNSRSSASAGKGRA